MKKIYLLFSMLLVMWLTLCFNFLKADNVPVSLSITAGSVTCTNSAGTWFATLWNIQAALTTWTLVWTAVSNTWYCDDAKWSLTWTQTWISVLDTSDLTNWATDSIAIANVKMSAPNWTQLLWANCTAVSDATTLTNINSTLYLLKKTWALNSTCRIATTPSIQVTVPPYKNLGTYTWTITVNLPSA